MPKIAPVSELRNYGQVLEMVKPSSPVYLTKNGHGVYSLHSIEDDETYEKAKAVVSLMTELAKGFGTGGDGEWLTDEELGRRVKALVGAKKEDETGK